MAAGLAAPPAQRAAEKGVDGAGHEFLFGLAEIGRTDPDLPAPRRIEFEGDALVAALALGETLDIAVGRRVFHGRSRELQGVRRGLLEGRREELRNACRTARVQEKKQAAIGGSAGGALDMLLKCGEKEFLHAAPAAGGGEEDVAAALGAEAKRQFDVVLAGAAGGDRRRR